MTTSSLNRETVERLFVAVIGSKRGRERLKSFGIYLLSVASVLVLWEWAARAFGLLILFPPPSTVLGTLSGLVLDGSIGLAALFSAGRILSGFLIGSLIGVFLGLLMGTSAVVRALAEPYVHFLRFVPPLAWFAPVLLWFGTGETTRILLITYTTVFVVTLNTIAGVSAVAINKARMARTLGADHRQVFFLVTLPASMPFIFTGMRLAMGNSFATVVAAEMLAADNGLGYMITSSQLSLDIPKIFSSVIALGVLGFAADRLFRALIDRFGGRYTVRQSAFE
ncbi:MAG: ABC transporter permease [Alphaproteobacteria bacterium]|nr:ABC transporter permease [Alphaproteobacteria bacterium]